MKRLFAAILCLCLLAGAVCPPAPRQQAQAQDRRKQSLHENRLLFHFYFFVGTSGDFVPGPANFS